VVGATSEVLVLRSYYDVFGIDRASGEVRFRHRVGVPLYGGRFAPLVDASGLVFEVFEALQEEGAWREVVAHDSRGRELWRLGGNRELVGLSPDAALVRRDGALAFVDRASGEVRPIGGLGQGAVCFARDVLYASDLSGLSAVGRDGSVLWSLPRAALPAASIVALGALPRRILALAGDGTLVCLEQGEPG
jgi:hypothetical protein